MKFYSEKLGKLYDLENELHEAEKEWEEKARQEALKAEEQVSAECQNDKKISAKKVESAKNELDRAYNDLEEVRESAKELLKKADEEAAQILEDCNNKVEAMMDEAHAKVRAAQKKYYEQVKEFNDKHGPYVVSYSGEKAYDEIKRFQNLFNDWKSIFRNNFQF